MIDKAELVTRICHGLCGFLLHVGILLPLSYFYEVHTFVKTLWWIFWLASLALFCFACAGAPAAAQQAACESRGDCHIRGVGVGFCVCPLGLWGPALLAGWYLLKNYSLVPHSDIAEGVTTDTVSDAYEDGTAEMYIFKEGVEGGYLQQSPEEPYGQAPAHFKSLFDFKCHGYKVERTCEREVCEHVCTGEGESKECEEKCDKEEYDCSYWVYPDTCHGYHFVSIAPLWDRLKSAAPDHPSALFFQVQTYLFDEGEGGKLAQHYSNQHRYFDVELCLGSNASSHYCAIDLREDLMHKYWNDYHKHEKVQSGIGKHQFEDINADKALETVRDVMRSPSSGVGFSPSTSFPLLWMPRQVSKIVEDFKKRRDEAFRDGAAAKTLLTYSITIPASCLILALCWAFCLCDDCCEMGETSVVATAGQLSRFRTRMRAGIAPSPPERFEPGRAPWVELPLWWASKPSREQPCKRIVSTEVMQAIQTLMDSTWKSTTTRDRTFNKVQQFQVVNVLHNLNGQMWANYHRARERIRNHRGTVDRIVAKTSSAFCSDGNEQSATPSWPKCLGHLDTEVNECLLFHGTKPSAANSICETDFSVDLAGSSSGALYGPGIYLAENSSKSDEYAQDDTSGVYQGLYAMLLCRVVCGQLLYTDEVLPNKDKLVRSCTGFDPPFDGVLGDRAKAKGTYREFVIFDSAQVYPEFVIIYRRSSPESELAKPLI